MKNTSLYDADRRLPFKITARSMLPGKAHIQTLYRAVLVDGDAGRRIFRFRLVLESGTIPDFLPGQYALLSFPPHPVLRAQRPFSIVSSPAEKNMLEFCIKDWDDWTAALKILLLSDHPSRVLRPRLRGPFGSFSYCNAPGSGRFVFLAAGMGINPFIAMLRSMALESRPIKVLLIWGAKNREELWAASELSELSAQIPGFRFFPVMSHDPLWKGEKGRLGAALMEKLVPSFFGQSEAAFEWNSASYWLCGPSGFRKDIRNLLKKKGIKRHALHEEIFIV